jgi:hypothetical protein
MKNIEDLNWESIQETMHGKGFCLLSKILKPEECDSLTAQYDDEDLYRKTIVMERYRFGLGEYKYLNYPLPNLIQNLRESFYPHLSTIANRWMQVLNIQHPFPNHFADFQQLCLENQQTRPTVLILKYGPGGYNTMHQDLYGDVFFPIQLVLFLSEPEIDYTGGEFVLLQQTPRAQSKAMVLKPHKGDILIFTTNFRPVRGNNGYYRVNMKHGVSEVHSGSRYTLGIIFHDALN